MLSLINTPSLISVSTPISGIIPSINANAIVRRKVKNINAVG